MLDAALSGFPSGGAYALIGVGVVLMYRFAGVMNIAIAVFGAFGAFVMVDLYGHDVSLVPATILGIATGAALSALVGALMAWQFSDSDAITRSVVTIGVSITLLSVAFRVFGDTARSFPALFDGSSIEISGQIVKTTSVVAVVLAVVLAGGLTMVLRFTRIGVRMAAMSERPVSAELIGVPLRRYTVLIWGLGGAIATVAPILVAPTRQADFTSLSLLVVPGLAAALLGAFRSFGITAFAGFAIGALEGIAVRWQTISVYRSTLPFLLILVVLLWSQRGEAWDEAR